MPKITLKVRQTITYKREMSVSNDQLSELESMSESELAEFAGEICFADRNSIVDVDNDEAEYIVSSTSNPGATSEGVNT